MNPVNIIHRFQQSATSFPTHTAIKDGAEVYNYQQILDRTTQLSGHLLNSGNADKKEFCFVFVDSLVEMVVAAIGVMRAGKVFVPVNIEFPDERIVQLMSDFNPDWVLLDEGIRKRWEVIQGKIGTADFRIAYLDNSDSEIDAETVSALDQIILAEDDPCYLYFTSGTTGKPKTILGAYRGLNHYIDWELDYLQLPGHPQVSQLTPPTFDPYFRDILIPLCSGGTICIPPKNQRVMELDKLLHWIEDQKINLMHCVPTLLRELVNYNKTSRSYPDLKYILLAGEKLFGEDVKRWSDMFGTTTQLVNIYGPTETSLAKFAHTISYESDLEGAVPVGKPIPGAKAILLDEELQPCKPGIVGEVYIRTAYMSLGYYQNQEQNDVSFIKHPLLKDPEERLYKTGDLAYVRADGNFVIQGRKDHQVKISGIRVELEEIEQAIKRYPSVENALVHFDSENKTLGACIQSKNEGFESELKKFLEDILPLNLIPAFYMIRKEFPKNNSGKIDHKGLRTSISEQISQRSQVTVLPSNVLEEQLVKIWSRVLKKEASKIGVDANFFMIGGNSLLATIVVAAIRKEIGSKLSIRDFFKCGTIKLLAAHLETLMDEKKLPPIIKQPHGERVPLSYTQEHLWFIDKLQNSQHYHMAAAFSIKGDLDVNALEEVHKIIIERHEILRTVYRDDHGVVYQEALATGNWRMEYAESLASTGESSIRSLIAQQKALPFSLSEDYMFRVLLVRISPKEHVLITVKHHIATDAWSEAILANELTEAYLSLVEHRAPNLPTLKIQYSDFAVWQRQNLTGKEYEQKLIFWKEKLAGIEPVNLQTDFLRPTKQSIRGAAINFEFDKAFREELQEFSKQNESTLYMTLLAAFKIMLFRYSGQTDISVGTPIANRLQKELEPLVGFFINTITLRSQFQHNATMLDVLKEVKKTTLDAYDHQEVPFEKVVEVVDPPRDLSRTPLYQIVFVLQNIPDISVMDVKDIQLSYLDFDRDTVQFDINYALREELHGLSLEVNYCQDLFREETIRQMVEHHKQILRQMIRDAKVKINEFPIYDKAIREEVIKIGSRTNTWESDKTVIDQFEQFASQSPDQVAISYKGIDLTYKALNQRANQLAHNLLEKGVRENSFVAICIDRSLDMFVSILGILKAGAAYIPIDPNYPAHRIQAIVEDAQASVAISNAGNESLLKDRIPELIRIDQPEDFATASIENPEVKIKPHSYAYSIFTSGSTGKPKGVIIPHAALSNLLQSFTELLSVKSSDSIMAITTYSFDMCKLELYLTLFNGGKIVLQDTETASNGQLLKDAIDRDPVSFIQATPASWQLLLDSGWENPHKSTLLCGGEALKEQLLNNLFAIGDFPIWNLYGPTETTVWSTAKRQQPNSPITIGSPINNTHLYVLDSNKNLCPMGAAGELYIGGEGVSSGYLNRQELTAEKFSKNPFHDGMMYRTGDLVRWNANNELDYLGRMDNQVKIRGFRIELDEVINVLMKHPQVRDAAVITNDDSVGLKKLVAFVVLNDRSQPEFLKEHVKTHLPDYMVPAVIVELQELPLTPNGKVDKKTLETLETSEAIQENFVEPSGTLELSLSEMWKKLLQLNQISVLDNFFELGGHSLLVTRLQSQIKQDHSIDIPLSVFFDRPAIRGLAQYIELMSSQQKEEVTEADVFDL